MTAVNELVSQLRIAMRSRQRDGMPPSLVMSIQDIQLLCDAAEMLCHITEESRSLKNACEIALNENEYPTTEYVGCQSGDIRKFVIAYKHAKKLIETGEKPK